MGAIQSSDDDREGRPSDALRRAVGVVIAVKDLTAAKSRLASEFSGADRTRLVLAMFVDTVTAAGSVSVVDSVTVVTPDPVVADTARQIGARVLDEPSASGARDPEARLNAAFSAAAAALRVDHAPRDRHGNPGAAPADRVDIVALQADLPALRPAELAQAYATAVSGGRSVVVDHHGTGTAALILKNSADEPRAAVRIGFRTPPHLVGSATTGRHVAGTSTRRRHRRRRTSGSSTRGRTGDDSRTPLTRLERRGIRNHRVIR